MYIVIYHGCRVVMLRWRVTKKSAFHSGNKPYNILTELTRALCAALVIFATLCTYVCRYAHGGGHFVVYCKVHF